MNKERASYHENRSETLFDKNKTGFGMSSKINFESFLFKIGKNFANGKTLIAQGMD